jgi:hypothetical protein
MIRNAGLPKDSTFSRYDKLNIPGDAVYGYPRNIFSDDVAGPLFSKSGLDSSRENLPPTLNINGKQRPTTNSEGRPIAQTEAAVRNFYAWFKNSVVVDDQGRPLVVYHGTRLGNDFYTFNTKYNDLGSHFGNNVTAKSFAYEGGKVFDTYINLRNPLRLIDKGGFDHYGIG